MSLTTPPVYSGISSAGGMSLTTPPVNSGNSFLGDSFGISDTGFSGSTPYLKGFSARKEVCI